MALVEAASLASQSGSGVVVVFVRHCPFGGGVSVFSAAAVRPLRDALDAEETVAHAQSIAILDPLGVPWSFVVRSGEPATELMHAAKEHGARTIVAAGRRHGALGSITHASVISRLLHRWPHSLLVVHPPEPLDAASSNSVATT
jgi:nucleotide-binding universal stress UspA family protein